METDNTHAVSRPRVRMMRIEEVIKELTNLLEHKQEIKVSDEDLLKLLQSVEDIEDLMAWHEGQSTMIGEHGELLSKICRNCFAAVMGCVEDLHNLEFAMNNGESNPKKSRYAKHALWNIACSFEGLKQAQSQPSLLKGESRKILNSYLATTLRLGVLILTILGYEDWAIPWTETIDAGTLDTIEFESAKMPYETNIEDTSLYGILNPTSKISSTGTPFDIVAQNPIRYEDTTPTLIHKRNGKIPDWNRKALRDNPKVRKMFEELNVDAPNPTSSEDEGSFNIGWKGFAVGEDTSAE